MYENEKAQAMGQGNVGYTDGYPSTRKIGGDFINQQVAAQPGFDPTARQTRDIETLQSIGMETADKMKRVNQQLGVMRGKLFGEAGIGQELNPPQNAPTPSVQQSLLAANEELPEAFRQIDSILKRL